MLLHERVDLPELESIELGTDTFTFGSSSESKLIMRSRCACDN